MWIEALTVSHEAIGKLVDRGLRPRITYPCFWRHTLSLDISTPDARLPYCECRSSVELLLSPPLWGWEPRFVVYKVVANSLSPLFKPSVPLQPGLITWQAAPRYLPRRGDDGE
jgi:hypothetical protein